MPRLIVATVALLGLASLAGAQGRTQDHYWLVAREGSDTTHLERVHRRSTVDGRTVLTSEVFVPTRARLVVNADADERGCIREATVSVYPWQTAASGTPIQRVTVALTGDSVLVEVSAGGTTRRLARPVSGATTIVPTESDAAASLVAECARSAPVVGAQSMLSVMVFPNLRQETIRASFQPGRVTLVSPSDSAEMSVDERRVVAMTLARGRSQVSRASSEETALRQFQVEDYAAPVGAGYTAHDVEVRSDDGAMLRGTLTLPSRVSGPVPVVLAISGSGPQNRDSLEPIADGWRPFRELAESLGPLGVAVLRMDDRGVGESEGDYGSSTERSQAANVAAALAMLRHRTDINSRRIALLGHSEGVRVAMMVAARDTGIAAIALLGGAVDTRAAVLAQARRRAESLSSSQATVDSIVESVHARIDSLRDTYERDVYRWEPESFSRAIRASVAIFHGGTDTQVPPQQAGDLASLFRRTGKSDISVQVFPGVNHLFVPDATGDFLAYGALPSARLDLSARDAIVGWLADRLLRQ